MELNKHGIETIHELKGVGKNLQDHLFFPVCAQSKTQEGINHYIPLLKQLKAAWNYFVNKKGVFCTGPLEGMAFFDLNQKGGKVNFQFHFSPIWLGNKYGYDAVSRSKVTKRYIKLVKWFQNFQISSIVSVISPFEPDRKECKQNLIGYKQIYLKCSLNAIHLKLVDLLLFD